MAKFLGSNGLTYLWSKIKAAFVSSVSISGNYLRITKNGSNTDLTVPYATKALQDGNGNSITSTYLKLGEPMQPTLFHSGDASKLYIEPIMDCMWAADKRWKVSAVLTDTSTGTETTLSSYDIAGWFNGDYGRVGYRFGDNKTLKITIQKNEDPENNYLFLYCDGRIILNFYWNGLPASLSGRIYYGNSSNKQWANLTFTQRGQKNGIYVSSNASYTYGRIIELTIVGQTISLDPNSTALSSIEWWRTRPEIDAYPTVHKYSPQTLYYALTAPQFIRSGGTSSQFLKADGSVDATSYAPQSSTYSKTEVDNKLANGVYIGNTVGTV